MPSYLTLGVFPESSLNEYCLEKQGAVCHDAIDAKIQEMMHHCIIIDGPGMNWEPTLVGSIKK